MTTAFDLARQGIRLWQEITGVNHDDTSYDLFKLGTMSDLKRAVAGLTHDPSGITSALLIIEFYKAYTAELRFSIDDVRNKVEAYQVAMARAEQMEAILGHPLLQDAKTQFEAAVLKAVSHYGASGNEKVLEAMHDTGLITDLRHSAFNSAHTLRVDQFLTGAFEPEDVKPVFVKTIYKWWNINSLLAAATRMPSGISLNYIAAKDALQSFFVITVRNGGNLYILSDKPKLSSPLEKRRNEGRVLDERVNKHWFPYELSGLDLDHFSGKVIHPKSEERSLSTHQVDLLPLAELKDISAESFLWTAMLFSLIVDRYWGQKQQAPQLSYTGEMVKDSQALLAYAGKANLPVVATQLPEFQRIDVHAITPGVATEDEIGLQVTNRYSWLEDRYGHRVAPDILNLTDSSESEITVFINHENKVVVADDDENSMELTRAVYAHPKNALRLSITEFGTQDELEKDRKFLARANYARSIQMLATQEFEARKAEVLAWFLRRCRENRDNILAYAHQDEIWLRTTGNIHNVGEHGPVIRFAKSDNQTFALERQENYKQAVMFHRFLKVYDLKNESPGNRYNVMFTWDGYKPVCHVTAAIASYEVAIRPLNSQDLAFMAGCAVEELPDVLQNWDLAECYTGNSRIGRVDPIHHLLEDPWRTLQLGVVFALSKRAMNAIRKTAKPIHFENLELIEHEEAVGMTTIRW